MEKSQTVGYQLHASLFSLQLEAAGLSPSIQCTIPCFLKCRLAAAIDVRMFHEQAQSDSALFNRLCPPDKQVNMGHFQDQAACAYRSETVSNPDFFFFSRENIADNTVNPAY